MEHSTSTPRTRTRMRNPENSRHLPREIVTEILRRLPFDAILRCKLVSKEWKNIINDPTFYKHYRDNKSAALFMYRHRLYCLRLRHDKKKLTNGRNPRFTVHQIPMGCEDTRTNTDSLFGREHHVFNWGSSNGIACVSGNGHFYFYNLVTGSAALHTVTDAPMHQCSCLWMRYGFGYDGYDDDYKIMVVCNYKLARDWPDELKVFDMNTDIDTVQNEENTLFWVYSFKNQGWKSFNDFPYSAYANDWRAYPQATTINGVLHWLAPHNVVIMTYDLHTGRFGEMGLPNVHALPDEIGNFGDRNLHELNGRLCYTYKGKFEPNSTYKRFYVWGVVGDSWAKLVSIDCSMLPFIPRNAGKWQTPLVLHECADGRILVLFVSRYICTDLFWYDPLGDKVETFRTKVWHKQRIQHKRKTRV